MARRQRGAQRPRARRASDPDRVVGRDAAGGDLMNLFRAAGVPTDGIVEERGAAAPGRRVSWRAATRPRASRWCGSTASRSTSRNRYGRRARGEVRRSRPARMRSSSPTTATHRDAASPRPDQDPRARGQRGRHRGQPLRFAPIHGLTAATPNEAELEALSGRPLDESGVEKCGRQLLERLDARLLLVTRGAAAWLLEREGSSTFLPIHGTDQIADVTGRAIR